MKRSNERRARERNNAFLWVQEIYVKVVLKRCQVVGADLPQISSRFMITTHQKMLSVIHDITRGLIHKGVRSSAKPWTLFQKENSIISRAKFDASAQTGYTTANDDDIVSHENTKERGRDLWINGLMKLNHINPSILARTTGKTHSIVPSGGQLSIHWSRGEFSADVAMEVFRGFASETQDHCDKKLERRRKSYML